MSWNLWARSPGLAELDRDAPEDVDPADDADGTGPGDGPDGEEPGTPAVQLLAEPPSPDHGRPRTGHVRPVVRPDLDEHGGARPTALARTTRSPHLAGHSGLRELGLPEHLVPPEGGIFPLLNLLERAPQARLPSLRSGDEVTVVTVGRRSASGRLSEQSPDADEVTDEVVRSLGSAGLEADPARLTVLSWPDEDDEHRAAAAEREIAGTLAARRSRLELIRIQADSPPTVAYAVCRALPMAQLYLVDVLRAHRPAAPLGWGSPVAFVDGRRASPAVLAAVFADRLAGGVA